MFYFFKSKTGTFSIEPDETCDGLQLFQLQRWGNAEHAFAVKTAVRDQNVTMGIESEKIAKRLDGDDGACRRMSGDIYGRSLCT